MSDEGAAAAEDERNIRIHLSAKATLKAVRVDGGFHILVGDDVEIRGVTPEHMRSLVGSVMDAYLPAGMASRFLNSWGNLGKRRTDRDSGPAVRGSGPGAADPGPNVRDAGPEDRPGRPEGPPEE
ncbi:MAG: hypothetical protein ACRDTU_15365 [Micromonosporaceae bacterium]